MNKFTNILSVVLLSALTSFVILHFNSSSNKIIKTEKLASDKIIETNILRCGYAVASPWFMADPNTKKLSGVGYDITNAIADKMGVKVKWIEETGWGVAEQGIISKRYDVLCGNVCIDPHRARAITFSNPIFHIPILAVVRKNDPKFTNGDLSRLNDPSVRIGVKNNHVFEYIANEKFPKATKIYANDISDDTEFLLMLETNKVDITFSGQATIGLYEKQHPGKVISLPEPARYCNGAFMLPQGDTHLKEMVDNAIGEINSSGQIGDIIKKHTKLDKRYVLVPAMPFREQN